MMQQSINSLTFKIGIIIILAEIVVLSIVGFIYIERFSETIDHRIEAQVILPAQLINRGLLNMASLAEQDTMKQLVGETLIESWAVDSDGHIFATFNPDYRGQNIADIPDIELSQFDFEQPQSYVESTRNNVSSITPIYRTGEDTPRLFIYIKVSTTEAELEKANISNLFLIGSIVTIMATSIIIFFSFKFLVFNRLTDVLNILKQVEAGDLTRHTTRSISNDELGILQQRVNSTVDTLKRRNDERNQAEIERLEHKQVLNLLKKEQEWNASIQRMIKVFSHELRTPLAVIRTSSDMLRLYPDKLTPERKQEKFTIITSQIEHMVQTLDDVVQVVQNAFQHQAIRLNQVNLEQLCCVTIEELQSTIGAKHQLVFVTDEQIKIVSADENLITRILINLLSNAIKYSPDGSQIRLELRHNNGISLSVIDEGMGISEADQAHIFDSFFRTANVTNIQGTGLGLSIVHDCVRLHRGQITVKSEVGIGSSFTVWLPLELPQ